MTLYIFGSMRQDLDATRLMLQNGIYLAISRLQRDYDSNWQWPIAGHPVIDIEAIYC